MSEQACQFLWFVNHTSARAPGDLTERGVVWAGVAELGRVVDDLERSAGLGCLLIAVEGDDIERELMDGRTGAVENLAHRRGNQLASVRPVLELGDKVRDSRLRGFRIGLLR